MSSFMHFRKRQLLEYQHETSTGLINASKKYFEYPSSPSSLNSGKSTPVEEENNNVAQTSKQSQTPIQFYSDTSNLPITSKNVDYSISSQVSPPPDNSAPQEDIASVSEDTASMVEIAYKLKQSIESYLNQMHIDTSVIRPKPSTVLLQKLENFKGREKEISPSFYKEQILTQDLTSATFIPEQVIPQDLTAKRLKIDESIKNIDDDQSDLDEQNIMIVEPDVQLDISPTSSNNSPTENTYTHEGLEKIANRISGIFGFVNRTQERVEDFMKKGINVYEVPEEVSSESYDSTTSYNSTPSTSKSRQSYSSKSMKNNSIIMSNNFVHVTADTKPEDYIHKPLSELNQIPFQLNKQNQDYKYPFISAQDENQVVIGPNGTTMSKVAWAKIDWNLSAPAITRKILMALFDRETLATHSLTGRPSPAFKDMNKPEKKPLDYLKVADTIYLVTSRVNATPKEVRMAITTKCADECKMRKWREQKQFSNKEN